MVRQMKDSGIEWIGEIPESWNVCRVKNVANVFTGNSIKDEDKDQYSDEYGARPYISSKDIDAQLNTIDYENGMYTKNEDDTFKVAQKGSTLMCIEGGSAGVKKAFLKREVSFVNKLCCFEPENVDEKYLYYSLMNPCFEDEFQKHISGLIGGVSVSALKNFAFLNPTIKEQQKIADFLDAKVTKIDEAIDKTRKTIEEYKALKQSIITKAVTKGVRGDRPMKDSGNIWFGEIPDEWQMQKLKYVFRIKKDIAGEDGHTVLSITQKGILPKDLSKNEGQIAESYKNYQIVNIGDFAMNHMDLLTGWVDISKYEGVTSPDYRVFNLIDKSKYNKQYYLYMVQMCYFNRIFYGLGQGVSGMGRWRLQAYKFLNFTIPVFGMKEQGEIAEYLDKKCSAIDELVSKKEQIITELEAYKKSLIYEYVTGKKEVM